MMPKSGKRPDDNYHITLIYSQFSDVDQRLISNLLQMVPVDYDLVYDSVDCFDSKKEGETDPTEAALVLKVNSPTAIKIHESLVSLGMEHSYPEFSPHVTLAYGVDIEEAYRCKNELNLWLEGLPVRPRVTTTRFESKAIDKDWVSKL
jgi:2'-5' RNA ligase